MTKRLTAGSDDVGSPASRASGGNSVRSLGIYWRHCDSSSSSRTARESAKIGLADHVATNLFDLMLLTLATSGDNGTKSTSWTRGFQPSTWIKCYSGDCWLEIRAIGPDAVMRGGYVVVQSRSEAAAWTPSTHERP
ncbi:hypothetical protein NL676_013768 [Syzygium grande]|nr:hypothetical protein NL676_013768 [Syzygium grande]